MQGWIPLEHIYVAVGVSILTFRSKSDPINLAGLSGSGKTGTATSMDPDEGNFLIFLDTLNFDQSLTNTCLKQLALSLSLMLWTFCQTKLVVKKKIPVLIMCNKTGKVNAHTKEFIKACHIFCMSTEFALGVAGKAFVTRWKIICAHRVDHFVREHVY
ncbi:hypothetical protein MKX03_022855 [Papaver bracteatum]|nr:hypothetical protein MKX03_022855 [Papaver bracteatum]